MNKAQSGVALILVLIIVATATVLAASYLTRQQQAVQRSTYQTFTDQAYQYALAAEEWSLLLLQQDAQDNSTDSLQDNWAIDLPLIPVENGYLSARLSDAQAGWNINNLFEDEGVSELSLQRLQRLLRSQDVPESLLEAALDWIDTDADPTGFAGAEDDFYTRLQPAYLAANQPLLSLSEMRLWRGMSDVYYRRLAPLLTALPRGAWLNLNTAQAPALLALNLPDATLQTLDEERQREPFASVADFTTRMGLEESQLPTQGLGVNSQYFYLDTEVVIAEVGYAQSCLIERDRGGQARVLRRWRVPYLPEEQQGETALPESSEKGAQQTQ